jgi:hypothetical protein
VAESEAGSPLLASLRSQSARFPAEMREFEISLVAQEFKRAYGMMARLKERGVWQPAPDATEALEDFWWEYGQ